jgi:dTDP-4-amino-4,6-dideoxygalactose transaminase
VTPSLPPVRSTVPLRRSRAEEGLAALSSLFPGHSLYLYDSGTSALAAALQDARQHHPAKSPEVIVPAYGCPQLVSACLYAKVRPRVVDTAPGQWGFSSEKLRQALTPDTVAILAANLLGVGDQAAELLPIARANGSFLVQDSAQHVPAAAQSAWCADYIVLSFGRGKPLNLLRGGALAVPGRHADSLLTQVPVLSGMRARLTEAAFASRMAALAFNLITHPRLYGLVTRVPGLGLGDTVYKAHERLVRLPTSAWRQVGPGFEKYRQEPWRFPWREVLPGWTRLGIEELTCSGTAPRVLDRRLRLALLARDRSLRDRLVETLNRSGLGASIMYGSAIDAIDAIPAQVRSQGPFPNAVDLAERLFTLPTHVAVTSDIVSQTHECLCGAAVKEPV